MLKLTNLMISTGNFETLKKFYEGVFEKEMDPMMGWELGGIYFSVMDHSEVHGKTTEGPRIMFNLESENVPADFARITALEGADAIKEPYQMTMEGAVIPKEEETEDGFWIATIADPDGNFFQLMSPWNPTN